MQNFWKTVWATFLGLLIFNIVLFLFFLFICSGLISSALHSESAVTTVPENAVLDINFSDMTIGEQTIVDDPWANLVFGSYGNIQETRTIGILDATSAIESAALDPSIKMIYLRPDQATDISHLEEFRTALVKFHSCGKPVIAYMENPTNAGYYLASAADRIYMSNYNGGINLMNGLNGNLIFLKDLLDKLGIKVQLIRHGKYKSAGEMFVRNNASDENLEQNQVMIKGLWNEMAAAMVSKSGMSTSEFNSLIDELKLATPGDFLRYDLVDELVGIEVMKQRLCTMCEVDKYSDIQSISFADYSTLRNVPDMKIPDEIAVIYADGDIVDGDDPEGVAGKRFVKEIDKVRLDEDIKAVVLRVNSPGGSVTAASQIKDAIDSLKKVKPVIASYGSYAASGGYWISAGCSCIFTDATTLTGSIGVFGMVPDFSGTLKNIAHVNVVSVPSNSHSDMYSLTRPLSEEETSFIQKNIEIVYKEFVGLVAEGRNLESTYVDELGQGRVWTGRDAVANHLVDRIGTLKDAVEYASNLCGCPSYRVVSFPARLSLMEQMMDALQDSNDGTLILAQGLEKFCGVSNSTFKSLSNLATMDKPVIYARIPYLMDIR